MKQHHFSRFVHAGRAIRHRGDYACIVLCDHRYSRTGTLQKLPEWIRSSTRTHTSFGPAFASIRKVRCLKTRRKSTLLRILEWSCILCSSIQLCDVLMRQTVVNVTLCSPAVLSVVMSGCCQDEDVCWQYVHSLIIYLIPPQFFLEKRQRPSL